MLLCLLYVYWRFFPEQVCQWLLALGMESYITLFMDKTITGAALLNLDSSGLKELGIKNKDDREKIKKKIKELKSHNEREKKDMEKEKSKREKLLKKAEKVIRKKWLYIVLVMYDPRKLKLSYLCRRKMKILEMNKFPSIGVII